MPTIIRKEISTSSIKSSNNCRKPETMGIGSSSPSNNNNNSNNKSPSEKTITTCKSNNAKFKEIPVIPMSDLKSILTLYDSQGNLYFNHNLLRDHSKEITILLTYTIHSDCIPSIKDNLDNALKKFISIDCRPQYDNCIEEFLNNFMLLHLDCFEKNVEESNYLHLLTQTVATNNNITISELVDCVKQFVDDSPKYVSLNLESKKRKFDSISNETLKKYDCTTRINTSLMRAEKYLKTSKKETSNYASHLLDVAPPPSVTFHNNTTEECDKFIFPFRGDVLELDKNQYPALYDWVQETQTIMQQDLSGKVSFSGVPSIEKGMEFCVKFTCEQLSSTGNPLPVHLQKLLNYFNEIDSLSQLTTNNDTSKNIKHVADVSDLILHDPVENKMKLMHPYYQYYYYHYYLSLFNSLENEIPESGDNPFLCMASPKTVPLYRPAFGKRVRNMKNPHPDVTPTLESFSSQEFGFPFNLSRNNLQTE